MPKIITLNTERLHLRQWQQNDYKAFRKMNTDTEVMRYYPNTLSTQESDAMADKISRLIEQRGWGFWALELKKSRQFIGFTGLHIPKDDFPFSPCTEIDWRLDKAYWGNGYATEAAHTALNFAFTSLQLESVVSFAVIKNIKSIAVMERLGMKNTHRNFIHPAIPEAHPLQEHVLYEITQKAWKET
ncbi:MAG: GNAT family N-acetyltransferase [Cellvibrionaceae bacterium]